MLGVVVTVCVVCDCERGCAVGKLCCFAVLKLGVDINVGLDKEGLVLVMYVGVGLVLVWFAEK